MGLSILFKSVKGPKTESVRATALHSPQVSHLLFPGSVVPRNCGSWWSPGLVKGPRSRQLYFHSLVFERRELSPLRKPLVPPLSPLSSKLTFHLPPSLALTSPWQQKTLCKLSPDILSGLYSPALLLILCLYSRWAGGMETAPWGTQSRRIGRRMANRLRFHIILSYTCNSEPRLFRWFMDSPLNPNPYIQLPIPYMGPSNWNIPLIQSLTIPCF